MTLLTHSGDVFYGTSIVDDIRLNGASVYEQTQLYVATTGNDANPGTRALPLLTLSGAKAAVSSAISAGISGDIGVFFESGTYRISETELFSTTDYDGSHRITYKSFPGHEAIFNGSTVIDGTWVLDNGTTYYIDLPGQDNFNVLIVDGIMRNRARWPVEGQFHLMEEYNSGDWAAAGFDPQFSFPYDQIVGDPSSMLTGTGIEVVAYTDFGVDRMRVSGIVDSGLYTIDGQWNKDYAWQKNYGRYFYENSKDFISEDGDWYYDSGINRLYYKLDPPQTTGSIVVEVPQTSTLVSFSGTAASMPELTGDIAFSLFFNSDMDGGAGFSGSMINNRSQVANGYDIYLTNDAYGSGYITLRYNNTYVRGTGTNGLNDSSWHHLLVSVDQNTNLGYIFVDGTEVSGYQGGSQAVSSTFSNLHPPRFGKVSSSVYQGYLDNILIADMALTTDAAAAKLASNDYSDVTGNIIFHMPMSYTGDYNINSSTINGIAYGYTFQATPRYYSYPQWINGGAGHEVCLEFDGIDDDLDCYYYGGNQIKNVRLKNLTFINTNWDSLNDASGHSYDSNVYYIGLPGAVKFEYSSGCSVDGCTFYNIGGSAIHTMASERFNASRNTIHDVGYIGIAIDANGTERNSNQRRIIGQKRWQQHTVNDNHIYKAGRVGKRSFGIWFLYTSDSVANYNYIHNVPYCGIGHMSILDALDYGYTNLEFGYNVIRHCMEENADGGGTLCHGYVTNGRIHHNYFKDIVRTSYHVVRRDQESNPVPAHLIRAIHVDTGASQWLFDNNLVQRFATGGINLHNAGDITITNNIFVDPEPIDGSASIFTININKIRHEPDYALKYAVNTTITKNIFYANIGSQACYSFRIPSDSALQEQLASGLGTWDYNLFGTNDISVRDAVGDIPVQYPLDWVRTTGIVAPYTHRGLEQDHNSITGDPLFTDYDNDDFTVLPGSPALALGFENFEVRSFPELYTGPIFGMGDPPNIATDYLAHVDWRENRLANIRGICSSERSTTYYFSTTGNDSNDGLTTSTPKQTIAEANSLAGPDIRLRFERGGVWREASGIEYHGDYLTIDDYGTGDKPVFDRFLIQHLAADDDWSLVAGDMYSTTQSETVVSIKFTADPLNTARSGALIEMSGTGECFALPNSWCWDSGTLLYVNLSGDNPNDYDIDVLETNEISAIELRGNECRVENIVGYGWGMSDTDTSSQETMVKIYNHTRDIVYVVGCEGFYSASHAMAFWSNQVAGGGALFERCSAGYTNFNSAGETIFNSYNAYGGQEVWFVDCTGLHGTLPSYKWNYPIGSRGRGFYAHTNTNTLGLQYLLRCTIGSGYDPCTNGMSADNLPVPTGEDLRMARNFIVNCVVPPVSTSGISHSSIDGTVNYGNRLYFAPENSRSVLGSNVKNCWYINCYAEIDGLGKGNTTYGFFDEPAGAVPRIWNSHFHVKNAIRTSANGFGMEYANRIAGADTMPSGQAYNSIFSTTSTDPDAYYFGFNNNASYIDSNAYYGLVQDSGDSRGWDNDANAVVPTSLPEFGTSHSDLLGSGSLNFIPQTPYYVKPYVTHDINGKARGTGIQDIGPVDYSN